MYRLKEKLIIVKGQTSFILKGGDDFHRNHVIIEEGEAVVMITPVKSNTEFTIPLNVFETLFFKLSVDE